MNPPSAPGTVYLVGAGPGAADLITLRGARLLAAADIVFYDALITPELLALAPQAEQVNVGKRSLAPSTPQATINQLLVAAARQHRVVVRLKGGDPMLFGRATEEMDALRAQGIPCEVVPGVTAALAASAALGVSLTERGVARNVTLATARVGSGEQSSAWEGAVAQADTAALYMGMQQAAELTRTLLAAGRSPDTPVVLVTNASLPTMQHHVTTLRHLGDAARWPVAGPAIVLLGAVFRKLAITPAPATRNAAK